MSEAVAAWDSMGPAMRAQYLALDDPAGTLVRALARKKLVELEIERLGLDSLPAVAALRQAWLLRYARMEMADSLSGLHDSLLTPGDLDYFLAHFGKLVWFTAAPGEAHEVADGPVHLPELPRALACHLDSMRAGQVLPGPGGIRFRLDSVFVPDPGRLREALADTAAALDYARARLVTVMTARDMSSIESSVCGDRGTGFEYRPEAIRRFALAFGRGVPSAPGDTLIASDFGAVTAGVLDAWLLSQGMPAGAATDTLLLMQALEGMALDLSMVEYLRGTCPGTSGRIASEAAGRALELAAEILYRDSVLSVVEVTGELVEAAYAGMDSIPAIPEKRSFMVALVPADSLERCRESLAAGRFRGIVDSMGFWADCSRDDPPTRITRPLGREELPSGADAAFAIPSSDTLSWSGPWPLPDGSFVLYRLIRAWPRHPASFEELRDGLAAALAEQLEEERAEVWIGSLERRYGLEVNADLLEELPPDPSRWGP